MKSAANRLRAGLFDVLRRYSSPASEIQRKILVSVSIKHKPYRTAAAMFQIGLRPMDEARWLDLGPDHAPFMAEKRARLAADTGLFYRALPKSRGAQHELRGLLAAHLVRDHGEHFALEGDSLRDLIDGTVHDLAGDSVEPLRVIGAMVEEDFVILQIIDGRAVITAASNAYSSSGRIVSSVGHAIPWAHQPVPQLNDQLGGRIDRILANVQTGKPVERFNWMLTPIASRLFPANPHAGKLAAVEDALDTLNRDFSRAGELLWIRVERQTLLRMPETGAVAFSIHTYSDPLSSLEGDTESLKAMHGLISGYSEDMLRYSTMSAIKAPVLAWLSAQAA